VRCGINYLTQSSTWRGLIAIGVAAGLFSISPEAQDSIVQSALLIVAAGQGLIGTINLVRNQKK
jgi:hypothetical protein